eukprot:JP447728.1.p3 GENE.JP447728.1~~JP447728.1.p3  ORF type:complete len:93 (-),score=3.94 JP447728.1:156-434(-)
MLKSFLQVRKMNHPAQKRVSVWGVEHQSRAAIMRVLVRSAIVVVAFFVVNGMNAKLLGGASALETFTAPVRTAESTTAAAASETPTATSGNV